MELLAGFVFGIAGSLHCIGMCGPIALALPGGGQTATRYFVGRVLYNLGRVVTYALLGAFIGLLGAKVLLPIFQQYLSIVAGGVVLASVLLPRLFHRTSLLSVSLSPFLQRLQERIAWLMQRRSPTALFALGLLNGLLPCGFVYLAIATGAVIANPVKGALFMAGFGLGTVPAMFAISFSPRVISSTLRIKLTRLLPALTLLVGLLLIVRGLNLGIPYLSPRLSSPERTIQSPSHH